MAEPDCVPNTELWAGLESQQLAFRGDLCSQVKEEPTVIDAGEEGRNESPGEGGALEGRENTYSQTSN